MPTGEVSVSLHPACLDQSAAGQAIARYVAARKELDESVRSLAETFGVEVSDSLFDGDSGDSL